MNRLCLFSSLMLIVGTYSWDIQTTTRVVRALNGFRWKGIRTNSTRWPTTADHRPIADCRLPTTDHRPTDRRPPTTDHRSTTTDCRGSTVLSLSSPLLPTGRHRQVYLSCFKYITYVLYAKGYLSLDRKNRHALSINQGIVAATVRHWTRTSWTHVYQTAVFEIIYCKSKVCRV